jgi:hypothetical protein
MDAEGVMANAPFRHFTRVGDLDLGEQIARRWIPPGKLDACCFADHAASPVAPHEIPRPQELAACHLDVDTGAVLGDIRHLTSAIERYPQLVDPAGQYALDVVLPQRESVGMPGGKVAHVQTNLGEPGELRRLPL